MNDIPMGTNSILNTLSRAAHNNAVEHGFYDAISQLTSVVTSCDEMETAYTAYETAKRDFILAQISKIASECGEAVAAIQHDEGDKAIGFELADIIIRTIDLAEYIEVKIGDLVVEKMRKKKERPRLHGKIC